MSDGEAAAPAKPARPLDRVAGDASGGAADRSGGERPQVDDEAHRRRAAAEDEPRPGAGEPEPQLPEQVLASRPGQVDADGLPAARVERVDERLRGVVAVE